ncbi:MAG: UDP-N-acetylmuramoyl-tripeptide--D-alanyl-D-alanine ligase [Mobiluncus porci]|uniref:UDP-N-acetylmuramoyl-tripeptide--D-alanyl-D- alanine ligase n=1 Tax=Mobiluncus porci TaxID=2652278 RepID=UPI0023F501EE|nr:UDP-N-acetylmuramoyl-tripeptide--D-alanyl-D-alanine ligase [Mobiluncus porci]MDD7542307.1 UDP-N-acetylmuramoyl-tripeptide--D-alanyl-D-alanine ligase [Mobiluncus porci]MDY5749106.1 UDP-N-acetylmuramoyl-tripeptide--D-alanyl-D-alanine ligase [Mobiluncus porci]
MTIDALREIVGLEPGTNSTRVQGGVFTDSRLVGAGDVFVALPGENTDGHHFLGSVARRGGKVAFITTPPEEIVEAGWATAEELSELTLIQVPDTQLALGEIAKAHLDQLRRRTRNGNGKLKLVVGITGSAGKTTTKDLTKQLLSTKGNTVAPQASFNNEVGLPLTVLKADPDTEYLVLEMGASQPGDIEYLTNIATLDVAAVLMVGTAHLESYDSVEALAAEKSQIVASLGPSGVAVLNADDSRVEAMSGRTSGRLMYFSTRKATPIRATNVKVDEESRGAFTLTTPTGEAPVALKLIGAHHISNALAAAAIAHLAGMNATEIAAVLNEATPQSEHRMHLIHLADGVDLIDDAYNANPDSVKAALDVLAKYASQRRVVAVLGDMLELGPIAPQLHGEIGRYCASIGIPVLIGVGPLAKNIESAYSALRRDGEHHHTLDEVAAGRLLQEVVRPRDLILIKGSNDSNLWKLAQTIEERGRVR